MILDVVSNRRRWSAETDPEISAVVTEVLGSLRSVDHESEWLSPGTNAWFSWWDHPRSDPAELPTNTLIVSINRETGYGGLIWFVSGEYANAGDEDVLGSIWVSDNPTPPDFDPEVVADPAEPYFFEPRSVLPVEQIEAAVQEFCRTRTGMRPECVRWTVGEVSGRRADRGDEEILYEF
jgi:hypothetical protein